MRLAEIDALIPNVPESFEKLRMPYLTQQTMSVIRCPSPYLAIIGPDINSASIKYISIDALILYSEVVRRYKKIDLLERH